MASKSILLRSIMLLILVSLVSAGARADSLEGWWKLDESSGSTAYDSSGSDNNGSLNGEPVWQDDGGVIDGALDFDGSNDWVNISNPGEYSTEADFTLPPCPARIEQNPHRTY